MCCGCYQQRIHESASYPHPTTLFVHSIVNEFTSLVPSNESDSYCLVMSLPSLAKVGPQVQWRCRSWSQFLKFIWKEEFWKFKIGEFMSEQKVHQHQSIIFFEWYEWWIQDIIDISIWLWPLYIQNRRLAFLDFSWLFWLFSCPQQVFATVLNSNNGHFVTRFSSLFPKQKINTSRKRDLSSEIYCPSRILPSAGYLYYWHMIGTKNMTELIFCFQNFGQSMAPHSALFERSTEPKM